MTRGMMKSKGETEREAAKPPQPDEEAANKPSAPISRLRVNGFMCFQLTQLGLRSN